MKKVIIIGAAAAGMTFAAKLSRNKDKFEQVVYEKRSYASLGACGIPFVVEGEAPHGIDDLIARSVEKHIENGINLKTNHEVTRIDFNNKKIIVKNLVSNEEFEDSYDELLIGTGANPQFFPWENSHLENIFTATTFEDAQKWIEITKSSQVKNVVIIGGGFIGLEMTEALSKQNKNVTIIEATNQLASSLDKDITSTIIEVATKHNVEVKLNEKVTKFAGEKNVSKVITDKGEYDVDVVLVAVGFKPNTKLFKDSKLKMDERGSIIINRKGQTNINHVWAAGDCVNVFNPLLNKDVYAPLATTSRKMATIIFENMVMGFDNEYLGWIGSSGFRFFEKEYFQTGITEKIAIANNINYKSVVINANDAASYSGKANPLTLKLIANEKMEIIGAQAVGTKRGAAIRIALLVSAITKKMTLSELEQLDLFYTPPFSSATDIIHIAARLLKKKY